MSKRSLVLYFQVHQPKRLGPFHFFDIGSGHSYFNESLNRQIIQRIAAECYLPANNLLLRLIRQYPGIRVAFSLSGVILEELEASAPEVLSSFRELAHTGSVEFLAETYYHSLACMMHGKEFETQIQMHSDKLRKYTGVRPAVFRNTELIYNNDIGSRVARLGYTGIITEGAERILGERHPDQLFQHPMAGDLKILLRNYRLSDDIAFRFRESGKPLTAEKFVSWLQAMPDGHEVINLSMDYETFGEHFKKESGIFRFMEELFRKLATESSYEMRTPSQAAEKLKRHSLLTVPNYISWADQEHDLSAWLGNEMQRDAFDSLALLGYAVKNQDNAELLEQWRHLQTSDHFYYMSTKKGSDGTVHSYFSPYPSPYEAFINYMNVISDLSIKIKTLSPADASHTWSMKELAEQQLSQVMGSRMTMLH